VKQIARYVLGKSASPAEPSAASGLPRLLIFDFDGTIADTFEQGFDILNTLSGEFGFRALGRDDLPRARDMRTRELMKFLGISATKMTRIARRGTEELALRIDGVQPLAGMCDMVRELVGRGFRLGIITSNAEPNVRAFLRNHNLEHFEFIRSSSKLFGKAHEIRAVRKQLKIAKEDILFIGDETRDIEASRKAGIRVAAVTWGYNSERSLKELEPDYLFETPEQLLAFLSRCK